MDRGLARIISAAGRTRRLIAALLAAGCSGRQREAPPPRRARADIVLPLETQTIEALVPRQATLETLLRQHELPAPLVQAAIESTRAVFNPRHLRAERPYRLVLSVDGFLKEFEYQIDADRFLRIVNRDRSAPEKLDAEVLLYEKETSVVGDPRPDRRRSLVAHLPPSTRPASASSWRSRSPSSSAGRSTSRTTCSRAIRSRCCSRRRSTKESSPATARSSPRDSRTKARSTRPIAG